ncbi:MAG: amidohydrolase family protein [Herbinix sp.]|nr:amidohydrolase family protein [Herbinix sp.]
MVIDTHVHPALFKEICMDQERFQNRCDEMNFHLMNPTDLPTLKKQYALAELERVVLLPQDCSMDYGTAIISNEEIKQIVEMDPTFFIGFASVDPRNDNAAIILTDAFERLKLSGLKINTAKLKMYPNDERLMKLYEICDKYQKPIIFHAGVSLEANTISKFAHPMEFEEVANRFPKVKMCLAHFGWPWVNETAALLVKYENVFANTAMMYMDSPKDLFEKVFKQDLGKYWLDHNFADKVMFGSDSPRIRPVRSKRGLDALEMEESTRRKVYHDNAVRFLGLEE